MPVERTEKKVVDPRMPKVPFKRKLYGIRSRCNDPNFKLYGAKGIKCFLTEDDLKFIWFRDEAWKLEKPEIDRIDSDGNYILINCRYIEKVDNNPVKQRPILQYDLNMKLVRKWTSAYRAIKEGGFDKGNVSRSLLNTNRSVKGFYFKYVNPIGDNQ